MEANWNFKRNVAIGFSLLLVLNISLCLFLIFGSKAMYKGKFLTKYRLHALPGPFFREENIRTISAFTIRYKDKNNKWGKWINPERQNFLKYHADYSRYDKLKQSGYERELSRRLALKLKRDSTNSYSKVREFSLLNTYLNDQYAPPHSDSVEFLYTLKSVRLVGIQFHVDTIFNIKYKYFKK